MKITYTSGSRYSDLPPRRKGGKSRNLDVLATIVVAVILIGGVVYWFVYSQITKVETVPTPAVVPLPKELIERPFNAADGLKQCEKLTPTLLTQAEKDKRAKCYAAVMTVFGTTDICKATSLDSTSAALCAAAQASYEQTHPAASTGNSAGSKNTNSTSAINTILNRTNTNTSSTGGTSGTSGTATKPGAQPGTKPPSGPQAPGSSATTTSTSTPGTVATNTPPPTGTNPDIVPSTGTPPGTTPGWSTSTPLEICIIDPGQLVLLQHTNECQ